MIINHVAKIYLFCNIINAWCGHRAHFGRILPSSLIATGLFWQTCFSPLGIESICWRNPHPRLGWWRGAAGCRWSFWRISSARCADAHGYARQATRWCGLAAVVPLWCFGRCVSAWKKNREAFLLALEVLDYLSPIQRSSRFVTRASCFLLGDSKTRNCPDSECYFASINAFLFIILLLYFYIWFIFSCLYFYVLRIW